MSLHSLHALRLCYNFNWPFITRVFSFFAFLFIFIGRPRKKRVRHDWWKSIKTNCFLKASRVHTERSAKANADYSTWALINRGRCVLQPINVLSLCEACIFMKLKAKHPVYQSQHNVKVRKLFGTCDGKSFRRFCIRYLFPLWFKHWIRLSYTHIQLYQLMFGFSSIGTSISHHEAFFHLNSFRSFKSMK